MERRGAGNVEGGNGEMVNYVEGEDEEWYVEGHSGRWGGCYAEGEMHEEVVMLRGEMTRWLC